ncbi:MAG TPA: two-component regulator propeller domain-containing protein [Lentimicrobium sp.]|nr:two-component regulator propeller domain-containing protein [Lentimicrobium sp.]
MPVFNHLHLVLRVVVIFLFFVFPISAESQGGPVNLKQYTEADGLPSSQIYKLITDQFGYIWIGTINGLARYDGHEFLRFYSNPNDSTSFKGLNVWSIFEDSKGRIWIASGPSFLNRYDPATRTFRQYEFISLIDHPANVEPGISTISESKNGRIYFGVNTNYGEAISTGLLWYNENKDVIEKVAFNFGNSINSAADQKGNIYLLSTKGLFRIGNDLTHENIPLPLNSLDIDSEYFTNIVSDKAGNIWLVTNTINLFSYNTESRTFKSYAPGENYRYNYPNIAVEKEGNIWIGTNKGLIKFDPLTGRFDSINGAANEYLRNTGILSLNFDSFGSLWIGTFSGGLFRYDGNNLFESFSYGADTKHSITHGWANNLYQSLDGKLWVTTSGAANEGGINSIDLKQGKVSVFPFSSLNSPVTIIFAFFEVSPNKFYISTNDGIYLFNPQSPELREKVNLPGIADSVFIHHIYKDKRGTLWLCTFDGLFGQSPGEEYFTQHDLSRLEGSNVASNEISYLYEAEKGLWLLTNNGLFFYEFDGGTISRHGFNKKADNVFISQDINSFYLDKNGIAWVGTWQGGLNRYDTKTGNVKIFTMNDGLPSMSVQGILADEQNQQIWLSTFEGLSRFDIKSEEFSNFSIADGLPSQLFADGACLETTDGKFVFGSSEGVSVINSREVRTNSQPPRIFLTGLKLGDKPVIPGKKSLLKKPIYETKEIKLKHNQNTLTIEFDAIHYRNPARNRTAYILENYDNQWREVGNQHFAFYSNLSPGEYTFRVKAANNNGIWNLDGPVLKIIINPPWWKTVWAYTGYAIMVVLLGFMADKYFRNRLIKKEEEYARARELEHAREIEKAYRELKNTQAQLIQSEKMASLGELTAGIAHEIKNPLNFVNNFSELNTELLNELVDEIKTGKIDTSLSLAENIRENEEKISIHGKRADSIIKGMLQHSRVNGIAETIDINVLAEEYLRLAYHGMRAKDKTFNTTIITDFDESIGSVRIIPQEIGRVILNLLTNAFYSVMEKKKQYGDGYEPMVTLSTRKNGKYIEIRISDNGKGIPEDIVEKIFLPFFTTKPTGQGTGLGLSMSYDIITKGHGGELKVETQLGEGAEFRILLPQKTTE